MTDTQALLSSAQHACREIAAKLESARRWLDRIRAGQVTEDVRQCQQLAADAAELLRLARLATAPAPQQLGLFDNPLQE